MKVLSIAFNTFRENLRDKLLYNLLIFALLMIGSSLILMRLTLGEFHRLILDIGLGSINFFGVLIAIFVGIGLVSKEIEKKTIYTIVSKPVARYQFLLGKYLGLSLTLLINTAIMAAGLLAVLYFQDVHVHHSVSAPVFHFLKRDAQRNFHSVCLCDRPSDDGFESVRSENGRCRTV